MNLFEIEKTIADLLENGLVFDEETGEITFTSDDLESLEMSLDKKIENICQYIKNEDCMANAIKEEERKLASRRKQHEKKIESLEKYLKLFMERTGKDGKTFETPKVKITFKKSISSLVSNEEILKEWIEQDEERKKAYYKIEEPTINVGELKKYLQSGIKEDKETKEKTFEIVIPGFQLVENKNLKIEGVK